jgi:protein SCO1/2
MVGVGVRWRGADTYRSLLILGFGSVVGDLRMHHGTQRSVRRTQRGSGWIFRWILAARAVHDARDLPDRHLGRPYNLSTTPSKPVTLLFFGYTHCPDVCIAVLSDVSLALQRLSPANRDQIQFVFVTTDPSRDKEKQIRRYLDRFNPAFVGLTGPLSTIKRAASQVGVDIQGMKRLPSGGYEVGHSAQVIGFSRNSGVVLWTPGTPIAALKHDFAVLVDRSR